MRLCRLLHPRIAGALFALEVCHTMGLQFYEVAPHAILSGTICLGKHIYKLAYM
jgi:hypothetical protein